jgi:hypothetical protein
MTPAASIAYESLGRGAIVIDTADMTAAALPLDKAAAPT